MADYSLENLVNPKGFTDTAISPPLPLYYKKTSEQKRQNQSPIEAGVLLNYPSKIKTDEDVKNLFYSFTNSPYATVFDESIKENLNSRKTLSKILSEMDYKFGFIDPEQVNAAFVHYFTTQGLAIYVNPAFVKLKEEEKQELSKKGIKCFYERPQEMKGVVAAVYFIPIIKNNRLVGFKKQARTDDQFHKHAHLASQKMGISYPEIAMAHFVLHEGGHGRNDFPPQKVVPEEILADQNAAEIFGKLIAYAKENKLKIPARYLQDLETAKNEIMFGRVPSVPDIYSRQQKRTTSLESYLPKSSLPLLHQYAKTDQLSSYQ